MRKIIVAMLLMLYSPSLVWADTLGETGIGGFFISTENIMFAGRFTATSNGTLDSIYGHMRIGPSRIAKCAVYNWETKELVDTSIASRGNDSGWIGYDLAIGANIYSDTVYALVAWGDAGGGEVGIYANLFGGLAGFGALTYGVWPKPWVPDDSATYNVSIYVTYTPEEAAGQIIIIQ